LSTLFVAGAPNDVDAISSLTIELPSGNAIDPDMVLAVGGSRGA